MEWSLNRILWRGKAIADAIVGANGDVRSEPRTIEDWRARLTEQGVSSEFASQIITELMAAYEDLGRGSAAALLGGVAVMNDAQARERADVARSMRDVREVERLIGAFSGELEKLDEVLEVLSAYSQKMRKGPGGPPGRTLH